MNKQERQDHQKKIVDSIKGIEAMTGTIIKAQGEHARNVQGLKAAKAMYTPEYIEREISKSSNNLAVKVSEVHQDISKRIGELRELFRARDSSLDFSDPSLSNALSMVKAMGQNLTHEQATQINNEFAHDLTALQTLQTVYRDNGIIFNGNIDSMIYNPEEMINQMQDAITTAANGKATVYPFVSQLGKLAELQGTNIDEGLNADAFGDALFRGAGM